MPVVSIEGMRVMGIDPGLTRCGLSVVQAGRGRSVIPVAVGVALSASLGFMLPVSTPPNAIVYASGYIPITKMIKTGVYIDVIGIAAVTIPVVLYLVNMIM